MPKAKRETGVQFKIVQQSYEDKDYEDAPKPVLVPMTRPKRKKEPMLRFGEDMPEDFSYRRNMLMVDDDAAEDIFEDEDECDFGQDFIKDMMHGDAPEDEEVEEIEDDEYPKHEERGTLERQFDRAMKEFERDEDVDADDPRTHGPLDVMDYAPALEAFVDEHAGASHLHDDPVRHKGRLHQMRILADDRRVFDSNATGHFYTVMADKDTRAREDFRKNKSHLKELTLSAVRDGAVDDRDVLCVDDADLPKESVTVKPKAQYDCETVLTTYSTLFNHPNVIQAGPRSIKLTLGAAKKHKDPSAPVAPTRAMEPEEDDEDDLPLIDLSDRPKDESAEEKKLRRQLVKQLQRERRAEKKAVKTAYQSAERHERVQRPKSSQERKQASMSLVRGTV